MPTFVTRPMDKVVHHPIPLKKPTNDRTRVVHTITNNTESESSDLEHRSLKDRESANPIPSRPCTSQIKSQQNGAIGLQHPHRRQLPNRGGSVATSHQHSNHTSR